MGTWSHEPFGNDTANDWAYDLQGSKGLSYVEATLDNVLDRGSGYLAAPEAEKAVAAVEVLAKLMGKGTEFDAYTEEVDVWVASVRQKPTAGLLGKAQRALDRIMSKDSELLELWGESEDGEAWRTSIATLKNAVR